MIGKWSKIYWDSQFNLPVVPWSLCKSLTYQQYSQKFILRWEANFVFKALFLRELNRNKRLCVETDTHSQIQRITIPRHTISGCSADCYYVLQTQHLIHRNKRWFLMSYSILPPNIELVHTKITVDMQTIYYISSSADI